MYYIDKHNKIFLPLQINDKYHTKKFSDKPFYVKVDSKKITILSPTEFEEPIFLQKENVEGVDINLKHNFCILSNGKEFDYNRTYLNKIVNKLKRLDLNKSDNSIKQVKNILKSNEQHLKNLIKEVLFYCKRNHITDLVMEDLKNFDATFIKDLSTDFKYSRLTRLLRLANIKSWFLQQAEKRGIRVHTTPSFYTSQACPICGHVSKNNRKTQEEFICEKCDYSLNADHNAAINIWLRYVLDVLRLNKQLHSFDKYNRMIAKNINYESREIVIKSLVKCFC